MFYRFRSLLHWMHSFRPRFPGPLFNTVDLARHYLQASSQASRFPYSVKLDLSPACNLRCHACVHADSVRSMVSPSSISLKRRMPLEQAKRIIDQIKGKSTVLQLYYFGDPFMYRNLFEVTKHGYEAGLHVVVASNLSFRFTDDKICQLSRSGITHLRVGMDGFTQSVYERTKIGGKVDLVKSNLERLLAFRQKHNLRYPIVEAQYYKYQHNLVEQVRATRYFRQIGVDRIKSIWGTVHNSLDVDYGTYPIIEPKPSRPIPLCFHPWFDMVIKYNGDVIPCCEHRLGEQFSDDNRQPITLGNAFDDAIETIWNSEQYRQLRDTVRNRPMDATHQFCYGCPILYRCGLQNRLFNGRWHEVPDSRSGSEEIDQKVGCVNRKKSNVQQPAV